MEPTRQQRQAFINEELNWFHSVLVPELTKQLIKRGIKVTEDLLNSLEGQILNPGSDSDGGYSLKFLLHGRFVDMGAGRGYNKGLKKMQDKKDHIYSITAGSKVKKRKGNKWYSKTVWGISDRLLTRLVSNYTEEIAKTLQSQTI